MSTSVKGRDYLLHLTAGEKTLCGRLSASVNCAVGDVANEELCKSCVARRGARALNSAAEMVEILVAKEPR